MSAHSLKVVFDTGMWDKQALLLSSVGLTDTGRYRKAYVAIKKKDKSALLVNLGTDPNIFNLGMKMVRLRNRPPYYRVQCPLYPLMEKWVDPRAGLGTMEKRKISAWLGIEPQSSNPQCGYCAD